MGALGLDPIRGWREAARRAGADLELDELPSQVCDISPAEAEVHGFQLNYLPGQPVPRRLAEPLHDPNRTYAVEDLAKMLSWSSSQLKDSLELLNLQAGLRETLDRHAEQDLAEAPAPVTVVLLGEEHEQYKRAMAMAKRTLGSSARRRQCLGRVYQIYV